MEWIFSQHKVPVLLTPRACFYNVRHLKKVQGLSVRLMRYGNGIF